MKRLYGNIGLGKKLIEQRLLSIVVRDVPTILNTYMKSPFFTIKLILNACEIDSWGL